MCKTRGEVMECQSLRWGSGALGRAALIAPIQRLAVQSTVETSLSTSMTYNGVCKAPHACPRACSRVSLDRRSCGDVDSDSLDSRSAPVRRVRLRAGRDAVRGRSAAPLRRHDGRPGEDALAVLEVSPARRTRAADHPRRRVAPRARGNAQGLICGRPALDDRADRHSAPVDRRTRAHARFDRLRWRGGRPFFSLDRRD